MTIPFLDFLKKKSKPVMPAHNAVEKSSDERLSKTVMPNATRTVNAQDAFVSVAEPPPVASRPVVSFGNPMGTARNEIPPAVALALEPRVERTISVELADVVPQLPDGFTRPLEEADAARHILLKASEVERGMASGKPCVSAYTVYQQVPEIFLRQIGNDDTTQVPLPFKKVLEQLSKLHVRTDQNQEQVVPQMETPFLQVTLEDDVRFGTVTPVTKISSSELPSGRVELATAETLAAAQPEAAAMDKIVRQPPMHFPAPRIAPPNKVLPGSKKGNGNGNGAAIPPAPAPAPEKSALPAAIPFHLSPKGTDASATERVPASSGPSVPTGAPTRIPFKIAAPSDAVRPKPEPWLTKENFVDDDAAPAAAKGAVATSPRGGIIALSLKPILQNVLPLQLTREIGAVADDAMIEIPTALLEPQLVKGRISLAPDVFARHLPEKYQELFDASASDAAVVLPLQEVLKNLSGGSLRLREDQVEQEQGAHFETPFSAKADEDAQRFKVPATPVAKGSAPAPVVAPIAAALTPAKTPPVVEAKTPITPVVQVAPEQTEKPLSVEAAVTLPEPALPKPVMAEVPAVANGRTALQAVLETDDELDAKTVVAHLTKLAGVKACAIMFKDGLSLAGTLPEEFEADGLCAMAPSFLQRVGTHLQETKLGPLEAMTLFCAKAPVTFFMQDNLCLAAVHEKQELAPDIRERLARVLLELSRKYTHPA